MKVVLLHSGGMDSTTLLYQLYSQGCEVVAITFDYGQRHMREVTSSRNICRLTNTPLEEIPLTTNIFPRNSSLFRDSGKNVPHGHYAEESMKSTVVPFRNLIFVAVAAAKAVSVDADAVALGTHLGDHPVYPDCREDFLNPLQECLSVGDYNKVSLLFPFLNMTKKEIAKKAIALKVPLELTWTCYEGNAIPCEKCGACTERKEALDACQ